MVAEINGVATDELNLHRHLFGSDRILPPQPLRDGIAALQDGLCFYCHQPLGSGPEADQTRRHGRPRHGRSGPEPVTDRPPNAARDPRASGNHHRPTAA